ncbi:MAG: DnaJ domain-containing protein [Calditrichaeota bacterium]|nr:DnaJ domain-containing protein [Calditrichota bacterium]
MANPYEILGIRPDASPGEIKKAYFRLVKKYTPEKEPEKFKTIRLAYDQLKSHSGRAKTDFFVLKKPSDDFDLLPETAEAKLDVSFEDAIAAVEILVSDIYKTDFVDDYTEFGIAVFK